MTALAAVLGGVNLALLVWLVIVALRQSSYGTERQDLRGVVERLTLAAEVADAATGDLEANTAIARAEFSRVVILLDRIESHIAANGLSTARMEESGVRIEAERAHIAAALVVSDAKVQGVADDLEAAKQATRDVDPAHPGDQADAAAVGTAKHPPTRRASRGPQKT